MSKTFRTTYKPANHSRKIYSGNGVKSIFVLGMGHEGSGYHGHGSHSYLKDKSSRMLRARLKEEFRNENDLLYTEM